MTGSVDECKNGKWQARVQTNVWGRNMSVRGPRRSAQEKSKAESDLRDILHAGDLYVSEVANAIECDELASIEGDHAVYNAMLRVSEILKHKAAMQKPKNALEASALLAKFRAYADTPSDLRTLLTAGADPNVHLESGKGCVLCRIIMFAPQHHKVEMRQLLLNAGAVNTPELQSAWIRRVPSEKADHESPLEMHL